MPKFLAATTLFVVLASITFQARRAEAQTEVTAGAIFLSRHNDYNGTLIQDTGHLPLFRSDDLSTGVEGGLNVELTRQVNNDWALNTRYFNVDEWSLMDSVVTTDGAWLINSITLGDGAITTFDAQFSSDLESLEINGVYQVNDRLNLLAGARWISINESLHVDFFQGPTDYSDYDGFVNNDLIGAQGGAEYLFYDEGGMFTLEGFLKAGVYGNNLSYDGVYENGMVGTIVESSRTTSFVGELGLIANLYVTPNISINGGYQCLWVEGIGVLGGQLAAADWTTNSGIDHTSGAFYHGATATITFYR